MTDYVPVTYRTLIFCGSMTFTRRVQNSLSRFFLRSRFSAFDLSVSPGSACLSAAELPDVDFACRLATYFRMT